MLGDRNDMPTFFHACTYVRSYAETPIVTYVRTYVRTYVALYRGHPVRGREPLVLRSCRSGEVAAAPREPLRPGRNGKINPKPQTFTARPKPLPRPAFFAAPPRPSTCPASH